MNTIKKIAALLFCLILTASTLFASATAAEGNDGVVYNTFNIKLHRNHMLSCYGVTVYIDNVKAGRLEQGDMATFGAYMADNRAHELRFVADKAGVPDRTWTISNLQNGTILKIEIQAKRNQVKILSYDLIVGGDVVCGITQETREMVKMFGVVIDMWKPF